MTVIRHLGGAAAVAQVTYATPAGTIEAGDLFRFQIGNKVLTIASTSTSVASIVTQLVSAWNASTEPEYMEVTAAASGSSAVSLTANTPGKPFTVSTTTVESNGSTSDNQTFTTTTAGTASAGPNHWDTAGNYDSNTVPVSSDDVYIEGHAVDILYGLNSSSVVLETLNIAQNYTGRIGLPERNAGGYPEYRETYLNVASKVVRIGYGTGAGSGRLKLNTGSTQASATAFSILNSGAPLENGVESILLKANNSSNSIQILKGSVGLCVVTNTTGNFSAGASIGFTDQQATDSKVRFGSGVSLATVNQFGGVVETNSAVTTLNQQAGTHTHQAGTMGTANVDGGTLVYNSTGTITAANVGSGAHLDLSKDTRRLTVSALDLHAQSRLSDPYRRVNNLIVDLNRCSLSDVTIDLGTHVRISTTDPA